jgi:hypothetical protein
MTFRQGSRASSKAACSAAAQQLALRCNGGLLLKAVLAAMLLTAMLATPAEGVASPTPRLGAGGAAPVTCHATSHARGVLQASRPPLHWLWHLYSTVTWNSV